MKSQNSNKTCTRKLTYAVTLGLVLSILLVFHSCENRSGPIGEESHELHPEQGHDLAVTLTDAQMKAIGVELGRLEKKELTASLKANGILKVPNQNRATVTTLMGGVIQAINVQAGSNVSQGQVMATISNSTFINLQESYLSTVSRLVLAETEFERQKQLNAGNATALKTMQQAESEVNVLMAQKAALQKQLELIGIDAGSLSATNIKSVVDILSPISGTVSKVMVNIGSYVDANNPVAEIIDNSRLHLDLFVYEKDLDKLRKGQTIHFTLTNNAGKEYDAKIYAISNTFEENTKAIAVHATVEGDKQGLIDGMNVTALVSLENAKLDAVPEDALVHHDGIDYIFIKLDSGAHKSIHEHAENEPDSTGETTFEMIPVKAGTSDIGYTEITPLKTIPADAEIVTKGAFFIMAKMTNTGEHEH